MIQGLTILLQAGKVTYNNSRRRAVRMGQHVWLLIATIVTELLVITKWSQGMFTTPTPHSVKFGLTAGAILLILYPTMQVRGLPRPRYSDPTILSHSSAYLPYVDISGNVRREQKGRLVKFPALSLPPVTAELND